MLPKTPAETDDHDLFRQRLENIVDQRHELIRLAGVIDWSRFDTEFGALYAEVGRPGLPTRLMVGLHLLKHMKGLSDELVCAAWIENPYMQAFCGEVFFRHVLPLDRSSLTRWRGRIGAKRLETILAETIAAALKTGAMAPKHAERVTVDSTVQPKAVAHPGDSHLYHRAIDWLNRQANRHGVSLRQSYVRLADQARREAARLMHGPGHKQALRHVRRLKTWAGRLRRDIGRKIDGNADLQAAFKIALERVDRLLAQKREDKRKLYALHAPEVECIGKGKARTRYEFGVKVSIATTNARAPGGQFVLGAMALPGNPYDGHTLKGQITQIERLTGRSVERVYVDRGYRAHDEPDKARVVIARQRDIVSPTIKRELRRRNAVEPVIGHLKSDGLLRRNHLAGSQGDAINAILAAAGHNLRLILAWLRLLLAKIILDLWGQFQPARRHAIA